LRYSILTRTIEQAGLACRGGFHPVASDAVPILPDGTPTATLVIVGLVGSAGWPSFAGSPEAADGAADPLDRWSRRIIEGIAEELDAAPLYPFGGPPYHPFQRWARRAEAVHPSPLGILIHPDFGLWHLYRGALRLKERVELPPRDERPSPCESCAAKPCLATCPVGAFTAAGYAVARCAAHIASAAGRDCIEESCRARRACPVGAEHRYGAAQSRFHMNAFLAARRREAEQQ